VRYRWVGPSNNDRKGKAKVPYQDSGGPKRPINGVRWATALDRLEGRWLESIYNENRGFNDVHPTCDPGGGGDDSLGPLDSQTRQKTHCAADRNYRQTET
jgi:hypothetical protein